MLLGVAVLVEEKLQELAHLLALVALVDSGLEQDTPFHQTLFTQSQSVLAVLVFQREQALLEMLALTQPLTP